MIRYLMIYTLGFILGSVYALWYGGDPQLHASLFAISLIVISIGVDLNNKK